MTADIKGALAQIETSWKAFTHKGKSMTKKQVRAVLTFAIIKGYTTTDQIKDSEVDELISRVK